MTVTVFVPCRLVTVRAKVAFGETLSPMEREVLRLVAGGTATGGMEVPGVRDVRGVSQLLGLGDRLAMDVVFDLWRAGHLLIDFSDNTIDVTPVIRRHLADDTIDKIAYAESVDDNFEVMIDQITGHVMLANNVRRAPDSRLAIPEDGGSFGPADIGQDALLRALVSQTAKSDEESRNDRAEPGRRRRVVSAYLPPPQLRVSTGVRWLPVDVRLGEDVGSGRLRVSVIARDLPAGTREGIANYIADVAERSPRSRFGGAIRGSLDLEYVDPPRPADLFNRIEKLAIDALTAETGTLAARQERLTETANAAAEAFGQRVRTEVAARVVPDSELDGLVEELIAGAKRQIVLVSGRTDYAGLRRWLPQLQEKVEAGVQLVVVWGRRYNEELDSKARNVIQNMIRRAGQTPSARVIFADRSSRTGAGLVLADDRRALVTGDGLLSGGIPPGARLGMLIEAPDRRWCDVIEKLLGFARREVPDYRLGQAVLTTYGTMGHAEPAVPYEPIFLDRPRDVPEPESPATRIRAWSDAWTEAAGRLRADFAERSAPAAVPVADTQHRDLLWRGLHNATERLVIAGREIYAGVFDGPLAAGVEALLEAGISVTLRYERLTGAPDPQKRITRWQKTYGKLFRAARTPTAFSALVVDDEAVVGGFDYLGRSSETRAGRVAWQSQIGVRVTSAAVTDALAAVLGAPALRPVSRAAVPDGAGSALRADRMFHQLGLTGPADAAARGAIVRRAVDGPDPEPLLRYLIDSAPNDEIKRIAVAHVLTRADLPDESRARWLHWLFQHLWTEGRFVEAAILRAGIDDDVLRPRTQLATLAAARGTPAFPDAMTEALAYCDEPGEGTALAAVLLSELLADRPGPADEARLLADFLDNCEQYGLGPVWTEAFEAWAAYERRFGIALPWAAIRADLDRDQRNEEEEQAWSRLAKAHDRAAQVGFRHRIGIKLQHEMFTAANGPFAVLRRAIDGRNAAAVRAWLERRDVGDLAATIDKTADEIWSRGGLHTDQRVNYLRRLEDVKAAASDLPGSLDGVGGEMVQVEQARGVGRALAGAWAEMRAATEAIGLPERSLARRALDDIQVLVGWGREHG